MNERMYPIDFHWLVETALQDGFGIDDPVKLSAKPLDYLGHPLEVGLGIAAGPQTQLAQNLIAGYLAGARFFELKTVQTLDGEDLPVAKPCIDARDEAYNVEWSTELRVPDAMNEYIKAWVAIHILAKELSLGDPKAFVFNMSVGYTYEGITSKKIDDFLNGLIDASQTECFQDCLAQAEQLLPKLKHVTREDLANISPHICSSIALSTLHGAKPEEIEQIAGYLIEEKGLSTYVKCNPTLLGEAKVQALLKGLGFGRLAYDPDHFKNDLKIEDAEVMFHRLLDRARAKGVHFGVKLTNTFPVKNTDDVLEGDEKYLSGKALYPLSLSVAIELNKRFNGQLPMSYSGGADALSINQLFDCGIWPITVCTTLLKSGGYYRLSQMAKNLPQEVVSLDTAKMEELLEEVFSNPAYYSRPWVKKADYKVPLHQCGIAPCQDECPIHQDVDGYLEQMTKGNLDEAFDIILRDNALPAITGDCCYAYCESSCRRNHYDQPLEIRSAKAYITEKAHAKHLERIVTPEPNGRKVAIVGAGAAGMAAAWYFGQAGYSVDVYEATDRAGGILPYVVKSLKSHRRPIDLDLARIKALGVRFHMNHPVSSLDDLKADLKVLATGSQVTKKLLGEAPELEGTIKIGDMTRQKYSSVVQCMADAKELLELVSSQSRPVDRKTVVAKKGQLQLPVDLPQEGDRCLNCSSHCESCVDVCPNRANLAVDVGEPKREIVHVDALCNYCGNCEAFCPYDSRPYMEKFTVYRSQEDFQNSGQPGVFLGEPDKIRGERTKITDKLIEVLLSDEYAWLRDL